MLTALKQDVARFGRLRDALFAYLTVVRLVGELDLYPAQRVGRHGERMDKGRVGTMMPWQQRARRRSIERRRVACCCAPFLKAVFQIQVISGACGSKDVDASEKS